INYGASVGVAGLVLNVGSGVQVTSGITGSISAISVSGVNNNNQGALVINAPNVGITLLNDPSAPARNGLGTASKDGDAVSVGAGNINIRGSSDDLAISAIAFGSGVSQATVTYNGSISVSGSDSAGIYAATFGTGPATINASGNFTATNL